jgi:hypothetical protein
MRYAEHIERARSEPYPRRVGRVFGEDTSGIETEGERE